jgi:ketosteroid isomerase-like protein
MRISVKFLLVLCLLAGCKNNEMKPVEANLVSTTEVRDFITAYDKAWTGRDTIALKNLMDEGYVYFSSTGGMLTRTNIIGWFNPADKYKVDSAVRSEINIRQNGNSAIVDSRWIGGGTFDGTPFADDQRCGLVLLKINGVLRIISEHCVQIAK